MFPQSIATVTNLLDIAGQYSNYNRVLSYIFVKYWCWISLWDRYGIHNTRMSHRLLLEFVRSIFSDLGCVRKTDFLYQQYIIMPLSLSLSFVLFSHYFHFRHFRFCIILILVVILNYDGTALYGISRAYCGGGGDALPLHSETYFGNGIKGPLVLRLIKQPSTFYSYN